MEKVQKYSVNSVQQFSCLGMFLLKRDEAKRGWRKLHCVMIFTPSQILLG
jgi:hypothetical protein